MMSEAKTKARNIIEEAEQTTKQLVEEMEEKLKSLADQYKTMELHRDNLLADLKRFAGETVDRVERQKNKEREFNPDKFLATAKKEGKALLFPNEIEKETKRVLDTHQKIVLAEMKSTPAPTPVPAIPSAPKSFLRRYTVIGKVILEGLEFHAYHGVYPHERSSGNKFEVDIEVETRFSASAFHDDLSGTLDYEDLYKVIKTEMEKPSKLLETGRSFDSSEDTRDLSECNFSSGKYFEVQSSDRGSLQKGNRVSEKS
ncbi:MAG: dihydroneopterin aldolase [Bacteroidota bacterium]